MVFESMVSDLLNRFIGDYVENLDKSQLKIGIWGANLFLFQGEFDVPFKVKAGQIGKLTLKIPWKNLYNEAVVATLEGLYLLVVPGATIKYDATKEERYQQEAKQRELQRIEEALQAAARRGSGSSAAHLLFEVDSDAPSERQRRHGFLLCWSRSGCFRLRPSILMNDHNMFNSFCFLSDLPSSRSAVFKPLFASAKMCINPNAEMELKSPKANLQLEVQNIGIELTKPQYLSMVDVLESIDLMAKNAPYRKFRPDVPVHKSSNLWWRYAFNSIMEVHIRRVSHMWSWSKIKRHRENLRVYKAAYKSKLLSQNKPGPETERQLQDLEKTLDVFNITLARQQAQMEAIRSGQKLAGKKAAGQKQGWFSGWFGKKGKKEDKTCPQPSETLMTAEEKEKLYTAIGYSGSSHNLALPKEYVGVIITFQLLRTSVTFREQHHVPEILNIQMVNLSTKISQRPGAQAVRLEADLEHWYVTGLKQRDTVPSLIASVGDSSSSLLSVAFELNPEKVGIDQLLEIHSQPVEIIYDA
uniref:Chorein N-terminal domain-containing protein n=1 Tax=Cyprinodon variegatus TaxID=28743 RepID=A0A3Q2C9F4_CYPVA